MKGSKATDPLTLPVAAQPPTVVGAPLVWGAWWVVIGRAVGVGGTALLSFVLPRCLAPHECGNFLVAQNLVLLGTLMAASGLPLTIVKLLGEGVALHSRAWLRDTLLRSAQLLAVTSLGVTVLITLWLAMGGGMWLKLNINSVWLLA